MAAYFLSDTHLRLDRPDRGERLARLVGRLGPDDPLVVAGDLCDFWYSSRQRRRDPLACRGLRALADFRARGGSLTVLLGNHDTWLGPLYERSLGARVVPEPYRVEAFGLRVHLAHGHRLGGRLAWKGPMESRAFLAAFALLPTPLASSLESRLERSNLRRLAESDRRHLAAFRHYASALADSADIVALGHLHYHPLDDASMRPRLVVLGDWMAGSSYLVIDPDGARLVVQSGVA